MDTRKVDTCALSDDELDGVSGGMDVSGAASAEAAKKSQFALNNAQQDEENKAFQQLLQRS